MTRKPHHVATAVAVLSGAAALGACNREREADEGAAAIAETPQGSNTAVVVTPPPETGPATGTGATGAPAATPPKSSY